MAGFKIGGVLKKGKVSQTRFQATLIGGPELKAALAKLDRTVSGPIAKDAVRAMAEPIREDWASRVPVLDDNYQDAMTSEKAVRVSQTKTGASGSLAPRKNIADVEDEEEPFLYAARLEYGDADRPAQPSARPAFDAQKDRAVEAAADVLRRAVTSEFP